MLTDIRSLPGAQLDSSLVEGVSFHPASVLGPFEAKEARVFDGDLPSSLISPQLPQKLLLFDVSSSSTLPPVIHLSSIFFFFPLPKEVFCPDGGGGKA